MMALLRCYILAVNFTFILIIGSSIGFRLHPQESPLQDPNEATIRSSLGKKNSSENSVSRRKTFLEVLREERDSTYEGSQTNSERMEISSTRPLLEIVPESSMVNSDEKLLAFLKDNSIFEDPEEKVRAGETIRITSPVLKYFNAEDTVSDTDEYLQLQTGRSRYQSLMKVGNDPVSNDGTPGMSSLEEIGLRLRPTPTPRSDPPDGGQAAVLEAPPPGVGRPLNGTELNAFWLNHREAEAQSDICSERGVRTKVLCSRNILEVSLQLPEETTATVSFMESKELIVFRGKLFKFYGVLESVHGNPSHPIKLATRLTINDVLYNCIRCAELHGTLLIRTDDWDCSLGLACSEDLSQSSLEIYEANRAAPFPNMANVSLYFFSGQTDNVNKDTRAISGQKMALALKLETQGNSLDIFIKKCQVWDEDGHRVTMVEDGCSKSPFMKPIKTRKDVILKVGDSQDVIRRVLKYGVFTVFNTRPKDQNLTFICLIKVCDDQCPDQSDCQAQKSGSDFLIPSFARIITLRKTLRVFSRSNSDLSGNPVLLNTDQSVDNLTTGVRFEEDVVDLFNQKCVSWRFFYAMLALSAAFFVTVLILCLHFLWHRNRKHMHMMKYTQDEVESPSTTWHYLDYSSPRRRSPQQQISD